MNRHKLVLTRTYHATSPKYSIGELARSALCRLKGVRGLRVEQESEFEATISFETYWSEWPLGLDGLLAPFRLSILEGELAINGDNEVPSRTLESRVS